MQTADADFIRQHREAQRQRDIALHAAYIRECGAEPYGVYRCDLLTRGATPKNETLVAVRASAGEAMDEANRIKRSDPAHSYVVALA